MLWWNILDKFTTEQPTTPPAEYNGIKKNEFFLLTLVSARCREEIVSPNALFDIC